MICDLMTSLSIDMRTFMVREIKMEWDSLFCFLFFYEDFNVQILVLKIILMYYFHNFVLFKKKSDLCKT